MAVSGSTTQDDTEASIPSTFHQFQFLDRSDVARKARWTYFKILFFRTCLVIAVVFAVFSIYWGALCKVPARRVTGWLVDFDGDRVGQSLTTKLLNLTCPDIIWTVQPASNFPNGVVDLENAVVGEQCWVAIAINAGATARLNAALQSDDQAYNGSTAITAFGVEARNENAYRTFLRPATETALQKITFSLSTEIIAEIQANSTGFRAIASSTIVRPVWYTVDNLRPFDVPVATAVTFVGLIYLLILAFYVVNSGILARAESNLETQLTTGSLIRIRLITPIFIYLVLSFFYTLVSLAFHLPFTRTYGPAGFVLFWMLSWFGMMAAGLALETMITVLTTKYVQLFLILWIISNVSVCLWPVEMLPPVYGYARVAPFYQLSRGVRAIVFNTKSELGLNFGVLTVWILISCTTLPLVQAYRRGYTPRAFRKVQEKS
ncbi:hypothetical protein BDN72DRAFT_757861 [Pluteus cervinus]|uniref:Uncharacterized protein n=1 Tax=Pluteus cervinus TaxID=181527 RepID=A0ACD3BCQ7_9AGAR|nr:hypothetical protein BDN72DRAFT_757861 [Pluteus cervinus]